MVADRGRVLMDETQKDKSRAGRFRYLVERRVPKALRAINSVTNLSDRKNYEFTDDQAQQIIDALTESLDELKSEFARNSRSKKSSFELK